MGPIGGKRVALVKNRRASDKVNSESGYATPSPYHHSAAASDDTLLVAVNKRLIREIDERRRIETAMRQYENEMRLMSAQLLTAQEMERKTIAAELHDSIGQSLSAIKFSVENALGTVPTPHDLSGAAQFGPILSLIQHTIEEVRKISMNLHPSTLADLGIVPTIAWFGREFSSIYKQIQLETSIDIEETAVPVPLKTIIFRIIQEAMNNIVKHAKASQVYVQLHKVGLTIELIVQDNGIGIDADAVTSRSNGSKPGFGITGMRERAEFSGGAFSIDRAGKCGTVVRVCWPLPH